MNRFLLIPAAATLLLAATLPVRADIGVSAVAKMVSPTNDTDSTPAPGATGSESVTATSDHEVHVVGGSPNTPFWVSYSFELTIQTQIVNSVYFPAFGSGADSGRRDFDEEGRYDLSVGLTGSKTLQYGRRSANAFTNLRVPSVGGDTKQDTVSFVVGPVVASDL